MVVRTSDPYVAVRAKDRSGRVLGTSKVLRPEREISRLNNAIDKVVVSDALTADETEP
jgi:hypothetical protein